MKAKAPTVLNSKEKTSALVASIPINPAGEKIALGNSLKMLTTLFGQTEEAAKRLLGL